MNPITALRNGTRRVLETCPWKRPNAALLARSLRPHGWSSDSSTPDRRRVEAAAAWLARAQEVTGDGGFAGRYSLRTGWTSSYPETTGYLLPTLLRLSSELDESWLDRAGRAAEFLLAIQLPDGAFPGGEIAANRTEPSVFNTAQILAGLMTWHGATGDARALSAASRAMSWLEKEQTGDGTWRTHVFGDRASAYYAHAACWIAEFGVRYGRGSARDAATRHVDWVLSLRDPGTGWIDRSGFPDHHEQGLAVTHTLAYTLWGLLRSGSLLGREDAIGAVREASARVGRLLDRKGWLPAVVDARWRPRARYACLTGNCQMALVWLSLHDHEPDPQLLRWADAALEEPRAIQLLESADPGIRGGIPGSAPVFGPYVPGALPNWAAKFFIDALLDLDAAAHPGSD